MMIEIYEIPIITEREGQLGYLICLIDREKNMTRFRLTDNCRRVEDFDEKPNYKPQ